MYVTFLGREQQAADNPGQYVDLLANGMRLEQVAALFAASDEFLQNQGGGSNAGFVNALFTAAFGTPDRVASDWGAMVLKLQLDNGSLSRAQLADIVFTSTEYQQDVIKNDYHTLFGRDAEEGAIAYWSGHLAAGATDQQVLAAMLGDSGGEYFNRATA